MGAASMTIAATCPGCQQTYRLKDELAGKRVKCKNPECERAFVVPKPTVDAAELARADELAAAALADEPVAAAVETRTIAMICYVCEHAWTENWDLQGKNVLCPDCRTRQKVPEQKTNKPVDWRTARGGPTLARQEQLEGVVASGDAAFVSGEALRKAGLGLPELEPRPLWQKVVFVATPLLIVAGIAASVMTYSSRQTAANVSALMTAALQDLPEPGSDALPRAELGLARVGLLISAGEYYARREKTNDKELIEAVNTLARARQELDALPASVARDFLYGELVATQLKLGGASNLVDAGQRLRWVPQATGAGRARVSEKVYDVQSELRQTFERMNAPEKSVSVDARLAALRQVARAYMAAGHPDAADRLIPLLLTDTDQMDGMAHSGAAAFTVSGDATRATTLVSGLVPTLGPGRGASPVLIALAQVAPPVPPELTLPPTTGNPIPDAARIANAVSAMLQKKPNEAVALARQPGRADVRGRLLELLADLAEDPTPVVAAAAEIVSTDQGQGELGSVPDGTLVRLAGFAGRVRNAAAIETFAKACSRPAATVLARAEGKRQLWRVTNAAVPDAEVAYPAELREVQFGHLWARLAQARATAAAGQEQPATAFDGWGAKAGRPFGLAGSALGQQDREMPSAGSGG